MYISNIYLFTSKEGIKHYIKFLCDKYINITSNIVHFILSLEWNFFLEK
jgi:hypothetical protein